MKQSNAAMASDADNSVAGDTPVFEALLTPHRSLGRNGFVVLMSIAAVVTIAHGVVFAMAGAWPVAGFFGIDLLLLGGAFGLNYRAARAREIVSVSRTRLSISKIAPSGRTRDYRFNPFWARFRVSRHDEIGITRMNISGGGRSTDIGGFLNPDDRESFAKAFSGALATVRRR